MACPRAADRRPHPRLSASVIGVSDQQLQRWERRASTPMIAAAVLFLGAYAWPMFQPDLPVWALRLCRAATVGVWMLFAVDLLVRLRLAERRWVFLRRNWLDGATLAVPMLRPLRWLGAKQRSNTSESAGLTLMGVRLFNPARGTFTGPDPIRKGGESSYTYPADPINRAGAVKGGHVSLATLKPFSLQCSASVHFGRRSVQPLSIGLRRSRGSHYRTSGMSPTRQISTEGGSR